MTRKTVKMLHTCQQVRSDNDVSEVDILGHFRTFWDIMGRVWSIFSHNRLIEKNALQTDRRTDGPTDRRMDRLFYRDAWTHLKSLPKCPKISISDAQLSKRTCSFFLFLVLPSFFHSFFLLFFLSFSLFFLFFLSFFPFFLSFFFPLFFFYFFFIPATFFSLFFRGGSSKREAPLSARPWARAQRAHKVNRHSRLHDTQLKQRN